MTDAERIQLLFGPYRAPPLKKGDRALCLYRDRQVVITGWSDAPISWPLCMAFGSPHGRPGPLIDEELARAIQHESLSAIQYWWGVSDTTVKKWRRRLGVTRKNNEGTRRLMLDTIEHILEGRSETARKAAAGRRRSLRVSRGRAAIWSQDELALLGRMPDKEVAQRTGRSLGAVNKKRKELHLPALTEGPEGVHPKFWTAEEDEAIRTLPPEEVARRFKRSLVAIRQRRYHLGVPLQTEAAIARPPEA